MKKRTLLAIVLALVILSIPMGSLFTALAFEEADVPQLPTGYAAFVGTIVETGGDGVSFMLLEDADAAKTGFNNCTFRRE